MPVFRSRLPGTGCPGPGGPWPPGPRAGEGKWPLGWLPGSGGREGRGEREGERSLGVREVATPRRPLLGAQPPPGHPAVCPAQPKCRLHVQLLPASGPGPLVPEPASGCRGPARALPTRGLCWVAGAWLGLELLPGRQCPPPPLGGEGPCGCGPPVWVLGLLQTEAAFLREGHWRTRAPARMAGWAWRAEAEGWALEKSGGAWEAT